MDWCIESTAVLSSNDVLTSNKDTLDCDRVKLDLEDFLDSYPPPSDLEIQTLHDLTDTIENQWIKDNALFAYNRVMEVKERFRYYRKFLEQLIEERSRQQEEVGPEGEGHTQDGEREKKVRILEEVPSEEVEGKVDSLEGKVEDKGKVAEEEVFTENKSIKTVTTHHDVGVVKLRHPKPNVLSNSLMYDDTG